jgi:hypothetical protein
MTALELRTALSGMMSTYLGVPVYLSDQIAPTPPVPYIYYTVTAPYIPVSDIRGGIYDWYERDGQGCESRAEQAHCTISFTCCSENRWLDGADPPVYILGDDEAHTLADRAIAYLQHQGYYDLADAGIIVVEIMNVSDRSLFGVDEEARQYGFDCRLRYARSVERPIQIIAGVISSGALQNAPP